MKEELKDKGKAVKVLLIGLALKDEEFGRLFDKLRGGDFSAGPTSPIHQMQEILSALEFAGRELVGYWFVTDQGYLQRKMMVDANPTVLPQRNAELMLGSGDAILVELFRKAQLRDTNPVHEVRIEIHYESDEKEFIRYEPKEGLFLKTAKEKYDKEMRSPRSDR